MKKFWNWTREPDSGLAVMRIDGPIADDQIWGDEVTAKLFREELSKHTGDVVVYINSPGGSVTAASEIYSMLKERPGKTTARIESLAASAASVVAMGCDRVEMARTAYMMIHNSQTVAIGDHNDMAASAKLLDEIDGGILLAYEEKTGLPEEELKEMMENETWMNASTAISLGFADAFIRGVKGEDEKEDPEEDPEEEIAGEPAGEPEEEPEEEDPEQDPVEEDPDKKENARARARLRALC